MCFRASVVDPKKIRRQKEIWQKLIRNKLEGGIEYRIGHQLGGQLAKFLSERLHEKADSCWQGKTLRLIG